MFEVTLRFARETKRTVRYESDIAGAPITVLYVQKAALSTPFPDAIRVKVE